MDPKHIEVVYRVPGYKHTRVSGVCGLEVTVEDIRARYFHEYFGGRDAWVKDGEWGCVTHTD